MKKIINKGKRGAKNLADKALERAVKSEAGQKAIIRGAKEGVSEGVKVVAPEVVKQAGGLGKAAIYTGGAAATGIGATTIATSKSREEGKLIKDHRKLKKRHINDRRKAWKKNMDKKDIEHLEALNEVVNLGFGEEYEIEFDAYQRQLRQEARADKRRTKKVNRYVKKGDSYAKAHERHRYNTEHKRLKKNRRKAVAGEFFVPGYRGYQTAKEGQRTRAAITGKKTNELRYGLEALNDTLDFGRGLWKKGDKGMGRIMAEGQDRFGRFVPLDSSGPSKRMAKQSQDVAQENLIKIHGKDPYTKPKKKKAMYSDDPISGMKRAKGETLGYDPDTIDFRYGWVDDAGEGLMKAGKKMWGGAKGAGAAVKSSHMQGAMRKRMGGGATGYLKEGGRALGGKVGGSGFGQGAKKAWGGYADAMKGTQMRKGFGEYASSAMDATRQGLNGVPLNQNTVQKGMDGYMKGMGGLGKSALAYGGTAAVGAGAVAGIAGMGRKASNNKLDEELKDKRLHGYGADLELIEFEKDYTKTREREKKRRAKHDAKREKMVSKYKNKFGDNDREAHARYDRRQVIKGSLFNPVGGAPAMSRIHADHARRNFSSSDDAFMIELTAQLDNELNDIEYGSFNFNTTPGRNSQGQFSEVSTGGANPQAMAAAYGTGQQNKLATPPLRQPFDNVQEQAGNPSRTPYVG